MVLFNQKVINDCFMYLDTVVEETEAQSSGTIDSDSGGRVTSFHLGVRMGIRKPDEIIGLQGMREGRGGERGGWKGGL